MKAIILPAYNRNLLRAMLSLKLKETAIPKRGKGQLLIKMHAAVCNPSDVAFIRGAYNIVKDLPAIPGFEASGTVVDGDEEDEGLIGKKVSCFVQANDSGTWAEYFLTSKEDCLFLNDAFDMDQAAAFSVNPFTAYGMFDIARLRESKAIVQNAGGGMVAAFINTLAALENMDVINIVRKPETASRLLEEGNKYVLSEAEEEFEKKLTTMCHELEATTAFDAVGGALAGMMFNAMPPDAELVSYGGLSGKRIDGISEMDLIFRNKIISGFNLMDWKNELDVQDFEAVNNQLQQLVLTGKLSTLYQDHVKLENLVPGLKAYLGNMSGGKILIKA